MQLAVTHTHTPFYGHFPGKPELASNILNISQLSQSSIFIDLSPEHPHSAGQNSLYSPSRNFAKSSLGVRYV